MNIAIPFPILTTERLILREMRSTDADEVQQEGEAQKSVVRAVVL